jgi:xylulokinase
MGTFILAHDLGTTGNKATLFRHDGSLVASATAGYGVRYPRPGWAEQDADDYWAAFCSATRTLLDQAGCRASDIGVVSFSGQMMAALAVDRDGRPLRPSIIWADQRASVEAGELASRVPAARLYELTGQPVSAAYPVAKMMWLRKHEPDVFRRTACFLQAKDYLVFRLTGRLCTDLSDASGTQLLDITSLEWSAEVLQAAGIEARVLPEVLESTSIAGTVTAEAAAACGLRQGTQVAAGAGDGAAATCGAGVVSEGDAYICLGTSSWMATASRVPLGDPRRRAVTFCHFTRGLYFPCGSMQSGGAALTWFRESVVEGGAKHAAGAPGAAGAKSRDATDADPWAALERDVADVAPGAEGLLFLPYLMGERSPWWNADARACFVGLSMVHDRRHMARAVMEGVAYNMRAIAGIFSDLGHRYDSVRVIGGAARSAPWRQVLADVLERPIDLLAHVEESTSVGAAIAGGVAIGLFASLADAARLVHVVERAEPRPGTFAAYRSGYESFLQAYRQLEPVFASLAGRDAVSRPARPS